MLASSLKESTEHTIEWDDVDVAAFVSFWQFLYTGDYDGPTVRLFLKQSAGSSTNAFGTKGLFGASSTSDSTGPTNGFATGSLFGSTTINTPTVNATPSSTATGRLFGSTANTAPSTAGTGLFGSSTSNPPGNNTTDTFQATGLFANLATRPASPAGSSTSMGDSSGTKSRLWQQFSDLRPKKPAGTEFLLGAQVEITLVDTSAEMFKHHAQVYILAERYGVQHLEHNALSKLHRALASFRIDTYPDDLVALLEFCYEEPAPEDLRKMVALYGACYAKQLWACEGFADLMESSGQFAKDFMAYLIQRVD